MTTPSRPDIDALRKFSPEATSAVCFNATFVRDVVAWIDHLEHEDGPHVIRFDDQDSLEEYVEEYLNANGVEPTVALIDSNGTQTIAYRTAPGGDGYAFEFCMERLADTGQHHCCECSHDGGECPEFSGQWSPTFPVWVFQAVRR